MRLSRVIGPGAASFLVLWLALLAVGREGFFRDPGTFWHTVVGERVLSVGFFDTDPFTFTFGGARWIPHQWLGEVGMALAHRVAGLDTLLLATATVLAATFAWPTARLLKTGLHPALAAAVAAVAVAAAASHFHARPHLATIAGTAITAIALADVEAGRLRFAQLFWLVPVYLVWSNCHGGMLGGLATTALAAGGWTVARCLRWPSPVRDAKDAALLALVGAACAATAVANPYDLGLPRTWLAIMDSPELTRIIQEHSPLDLAEPMAWPLLAFAGVYLLVLAGTRPGRPRATWLLPLFWLAESCSRVRHAPLFAVTGLVAIAAMWPHTRWAARLARTRPDLQQPPATGAERRLHFWPNVGPPVVAVLVALGLQLARVPIPLVGSGWARLDPVKWPVALADALRAHEPKGTGGNRLFNEYIDGGFVIYHAPGYRVFVDDRCELFGDRWLVEFLMGEAEGTPEAIASWEKRYGRFDFALTRKGSGFEDYFAASPEWQCAQRSETAAFYVRKGTGRPAQ